MPTAAMRHLHAIAHATIALMLLGCTQEEQNDLPATTGEPVVTFLAAANDPTRGTAMSGSFSTDATFRVYATQQLRNGSSVADGSTPSVFIPGDVVSYQQVPAYGISHNLWVWKTATDYLWPQDNYFVNFYAIYPAEAPMMTDFPADKSFSYTDGDSNQLIDGDTDLMYAYVQTHRDDSEFTSVTPNVADNSTVHLQFHHLLTQIAFYGKLSPQFQTWGWTVEVGAITIHNVNAAGMVTFNEGVFNITAAATSVARNYTLAMNANRQPVTTTTVAKDTDNKNIPLTSPSDVTMLIPQTLTAWVPASTDGGSAITSNPAGSYLEVAMRIKDNKNQYVMGSADSYQTVYVPFATIFNSAKRQNYTLTFGGGYDTAGQPVIQPISIEAAIEPWQTTNVTATVKRGKNE